MKNQLIFVLLIMTVAIKPAFAGQDDQAELLKTFVELDNTLFEESFNKCRDEVLPPLISDDFEFYHDVAGIQNRTEFLNAIKANICSNMGRKPIRKLVAGSMEVFPLKKDNVLYGVIQRGVHEFYIKEPNKEIYKTGIAKFTHVWLLKNKQWQLKRVLSFDHQPASQ